jgi:hypothetical protein
MSEASQAGAVRLLLQRYEAGEISDAVFAKALRSIAADGDAADVRPGHWEYREFTVPLSSLGEFRMSGWPVDGSIPYSGAIGPINSAVQAFINRISTEGWEPTEPIDADRLYRARRLEGRARQTILHRLNGDSDSLFSPQSARINCRRWVPR